VREKAEDEEEDKDELEQEQEQDGFVLSLRAPYDGVRWGV